MRTATLELLERAKLPSEQALALAQAIELEVSSQRESVVSQSDFVDLRDELRSGLTPLKADVTELRGDVAQLKSDVTQLKADVALLKGDVTELKGDVTQLKTDVAQLKGDVALLKSDVTQLKADVAQLKGDVTELKADVAQLKGDVAQLKADVAGLKADVAQLTRLYMETRDVLHAWKSEIRVEMHSMKADLVRWVFTVMLGQTAVLLGGGYIVLSLFLT